MRKSTKTFDQLVLFDSNILIFAHDTSALFHNKAKALLTSAMDGELNMVLAQQNILEFYSVITNPKRVNSVLPVKDALSLVNGYIGDDLFNFIYPLRTTLIRTIYFCNLFSIKKAEIFDAFLAATMLDNDVRTIYTDNEKHFTIFPEIKVVNPFK